jgi:hypothetical protein
MDLTRRELAPLALSLAAACAAPAPPATAQQQRPRPGPSRPGAGPPLPQVPRPVRPNDIAGLTLQGGRPGGGELTMGLAFARGDLPRGAGLAARLVPGDRPLAVTLQVLSRHQDGSAKTALLALSPPPLQPGAHAGVLLERLPPGSTPL